MNESEFLNQFKEDLVEFLLLCSDSLHNSIKLRIIQNIEFSRCPFFGCFMYCAKFGECIARKRKYHDRYYSHCQLPHYKTAWEFYTKRDSAYTKWEWDRLSNEMISIVQEVIK